MNSSSRFTRPKAQCKNRKWDEYNKNLIHRGNLQIWISDAALLHWKCNETYQGRGAPKVYSDVCIRISLTIRLLFHLPLRQTQGFIQSLFRMKETNLPVPNYSTLCRRQAKLDVILTRATRRSRRYVLLVDSSGLKVFGEGEWKVRQHGYSKHRMWQKLHFGVDSKTQKIMAVKLTTNASHDSEAVPDLLSQIPILPKKMIGDGGYDTWNVYNRLKEDSILPIIPPQKNAKIKQRKNNTAKALQRDENIRQIRMKGRKIWKMETGYHQRSKAETAFFRFKNTFSDKLRSRNFDSQKTEVIIACQILNHFLDL